MSNHENHHVQELNQEVQIMNFLLFLSKEHS